jgi:hypothetical protein
MVATKRSTKQSREERTNLPMFDRSQDRGSNSINPRCSLTLVQKNRVRLEDEKY